jgi:hypothetical protein
MGLLRDLTPDVTRSADHGAVNAMKGPFLSKIERKGPFMAFPDGYMCTAAGASESITGTPGRSSSPQATAPRAKIPAAQANAVV